MGSFIAVLGKKKNNPYGPIFHLTNIRLYYEFLGICASPFLINKNNLVNNEEYNNSNNKKKIKNERKHHVRCAFIC